MAMYPKNVWDARTLNAATATATATAVYPATTLTTAANLATTRAKTKKHEWRKQQYYAQNMKLKQPPKKQSAEKDGMT